jgi:hypothetical protein
MKGIENQQLNTMSLLMGEVAKSTDLGVAGLSVGNSIDGVQPEEFLKTLKNIQSPESQKIALTEAMNANPNAKEALLEAMKGEFVDTEVGDTLDQIVLEKELEENVSDTELKTLLRNMKKTEQNFSKEIETMNKTGMPVEQISDPEQEEVLTDPKKQIFVGSNKVSKQGLKLTANDQINNQEIRNRFFVNNKQTNENKVAESDPRIPLKLDLKKQGVQKGKKIAAGTDFVQNMNTVNKAAANNLINLNTKSIKKNSNIKGYGKAQANIENNMFGLSGADFNTELKVENEFGSKMQVQTVSQNGAKANLEFMSASLDTQTPKGFDVINNNTKVLDMSSIDINNKTEIIAKIVNHIEQNKLESSSTIDLLVKHEELGNFRVNVSKTATNQVDLEIITQSSKGSEFFMKNEAEMIKALDQSGVKLLNYKLVSSSSHAEFSKVSSDSKNQGFDMGQQSSQEQSQSKQFQSGNKDSDRRRQLWQEYKEQTEERKSA